MSRKSVTVAATIAAAALAGALGGAGAYVVLGDGDTVVSRDLADDRRFDRHDDRDDHRR